MVKKKKIFCTCFKILLIFKFMHIWVNSWIILFQSFQRDCKLIREDQANIVTSWEAILCYRMKKFISAVVISLIWIPARWLTSYTHFATDLILLTPNFLLCKIEIIILIFLGYVMNFKQYFQSSQFIIKDL